MRVTSGGSSPSSRPHAQSVVQRMAARDLVAEHQLLLDASKEAQRHRATNYKHVFKNKVARSSKLYRSGLRDQQKDMGPLGRRAHDLPGAT